MYPVRPSPVTANRGAATPRADPEPDARNWSTLPPPTAALHSSLLVPPITHAETPRAPLRPRPAPELPRQKPSALTTSPLQSEPMTWVNFRVHQTGRMTKSTACPSPVSLRRTPMTLSKPAPASSSCAASCAGWVVVSAGIVAGSRVISLISCIPRRPPWSTRNRL